jgi:hypothetical protein
MNKEQLQAYIDNSYLEQYNFALDKFTTAYYTTGYAHDENGYYIYDVDERQNVHKHYKASEQECIDEVFEDLKFTLTNLHQSLPDLDNIKDTSSNSSEEYFVKLFNSRKSEIEKYICDELPEYRDSFDISELGDLHINMDAEYIYFENPIPDTDMYITIEFNTETNELLYISVDG